MLGDLLAFLKNNKRYWIPPILIFLALLVWLAWVAADTPASPFEYRMR